MCMNPRLSSGKDIRCDAIWEVRQIIFLQTSSGLNRFFITVGSNRRVVKESEKLYDQLPFAIRGMF